MVLDKVSALSYWIKSSEDEEAIVQEEATILDDIFGNCYDELIEACKDGKVTDDNAIIGAILSLMERVIPKLLDAYKKDPKEHDTRCLATATALRVTIGTFIPFDKFMDIMNRPEMKVIDHIVDDITENGKSEAKVDELAGIFSNMIQQKKIFTPPGIYG